VIKVAFIGAGSVEFTRNVAVDLCSYPELRDGIPARYGVRQTIGDTLGIGGIFRRLRKRHA
jgi:alpha-galactosidase/6-phospho-beta-glucosidase family protein